MLKLPKSIIKSTGRAIIRDPEVKKLKKKFPITSQFIKKRFSPDEKLGLYLTIGIIVFLFFIYFFFSIVNSLQKDKALIRADLRIVNLFDSVRTENLNNIMLFLTYLGEGSVVILGAIFLVWILLKKWKRNYAITLIISILFGQLFVFILKKYIHRARPSPINALISESSFSFPSGHAFIAVSFYLLLAYFCFKMSKNKLQKFLSIIAGFMVVFGIGLSRIYLGVHWPSDVLASYTSGIAWIVVLITVLEIRGKFNSGKDNIKFKKNRNIIIMIFFIIWVFYLIFYTVNHPVTKSELKFTQIKILDRDVPEEFFKNYSRYSEDLTGTPIEPINFIFIGNRADIEKAFYKANWMKTDLIRLKSMIRLLVASVFNKQYDQAPGIPSFWNTRPNDFAFEQPTEIHDIVERHHIHFWRTPFLVNDSEVWFSTAHFDKSSSSSKVSSAFAIHKIDPAIDKEREKIMSDLEKTGLVKEVKKHQIVELTAGTNVAGDLFYTDGNAYILYL